MEFRQRNNVVRSTVGILQQGRDTGDIYVCGMRQGVPFLLGYLPMVLLPAAFAVVALIAI